MNCVCCGSAAVTERRELTARGYRRFRCRDCGRQSNERSGGALNRTCLPSDVIAFVVFCRLRYRLTLRDLSEIMALRGIEVSHEAVRDWEAKLLPMMGDALRKGRHGSRRGSGVSWQVDETYLKVRGRWCYLYRAIDRDGNLVDAMLSEHRDMKAATAFFRSARATNMNNRLEQDHRGIKGRIRCMRGFKSHDAAYRFCRKHGELRDLLRPRRRHNQVVPASLRRLRFARGARVALGIMQNA